MKHIYSLLCLVLFVTASYGQNSQREKANKYFETYQYVDAIEVYLKMIDNNQANSNDYKQLGDSYYNLFNLDEASKYYEMASKSKQDSEFYYRYAQVLKSQGKYQDAIEQMDTFATMSPSDQRAKEHRQNPNYISSLDDQSILFHVKEAPINDPNESDFSPIMSNDNVLYFVSTRNHGSKKDKSTNEAYLDIYKSVRDENGEFSKPEPVKSLNSNYHDGPITISADGKTMIFASNGYRDGSFKKMKDKGIKLAQQGLYKASLVDGNWTNIKALPINSIEYSVSHPCLSQDGKTLYFASNMPNGFGDTDIWKVSVDNDTYGEPVNLGKHVNTPGKEGYPFVSSDNILYFASSGKQGFGGFDIFKVDLNKNEEAINLGKEINTRRDDFAFSINMEQEIGYFSSNRTGVDHIYMAIPICKFQTKLVVKDAVTNTVIPSATIAVVGANGDVISNAMTSQDGAMTFNALCKLSYVFNVSKVGYEPNSITVSETKAEDLTKTILLSPVHELITETEVKLNNIYFEFNKSNITQSGASELDKLVEIMNDYPDMKILVRSHTDTKGNSSYNMKLSERRAQSTVQYLVSKGVSKDRLTPEGVGSTEPKIDCKSDCTSEEDAQNRRSEFLIIK
ncbi:OmpA family protein [Tamlana sp. s12]|uniref:OmpA family protein n=1 Tax=Tamlana sp. s12 TaxID=1630406 RepID=UPI00080148F2|nr:OmpA family protein [Tamlana sp. s12]OBQ54178.1 hypothetical protein VQ01_12065 [Tamlana sp. s12]QQY81301.1 OmpA family protein [Tamlana sp. s12]